MLLKKTTQVLMARECNVVDFKGVVQFKGEALLGLLCQKPTPRKRKLQGLN